MQQEGIKYNFLSLWYYSTWNWTPFYVPLENTLSLSLYIYIYIYISLPTVVEVDPESPFSIATTPRCRGGWYSFLWIVLLTFDPYLVMLCVKQGSIENNFLSLRFDSTWDWTSVSRNIGKQSMPMGQFIYIYIYIYCLPPKKLFHMKVRIYLFKINVLLFQLL